MGVPSEPNNTPMSWKMSLSRGYIFQRTKRLWRVREFVPHKDIIPKVIPQSQVIIGPLLVQKIPGGPINRKSCDVKLAHMVSPKTFVHTFILHETILAMRVLGSLEELGTILKINFSSIALGIRPKWEINYFTLQILLEELNSYPPDQTPALHFRLPFY